MIKCFEKVEFREVYNNKIRYNNKFYPINNAVPSSRREFPYKLNIDGGFLIFNFLRPRRLIEMRACKC